MDPAAFSDLSPGRLVPTIQGQRAFAPDPLPPSIQVSPRLATALENATLGVGELSGIAGFIQNIELISRPLITREAIYSSRIEGTYASAEELALVGVGSPQVPRHSDTWEVWSYLDAISIGTRRIATEEVGLDLVRDLHRRLFGDLFSRGRLATPGEFRTIQNYIGASSSTPISQARYVPPPPAEMASALEALESYIRHDSGLPALIRLALIHYQFEAIHPFIDGNGRVGRMLVTLQLAKWGIVRQPILHLSTYFERERDKYISLLLKVSTHGAWDEWIEFFLTGIGEQARQAARRIHRLWKLREEYMDRVRVPQASALLPGLIDSLFERQMLTIPEAAKQLGITYPAARANVSRLVTTGILREGPNVGPHNAKVFVADEIMRMADDPDFD